MYTYIYIYTQCAGQFRSCAGQVRSCHVMSCHVMSHYGVVLNGTAQQVTVWYSTHIPVYLSWWGPCWLIYIYIYIYIYIEFSSLNKNHSDFIGERPSKVRNVRGFLTNDAPTIMASSLHSKTMYPESQTVPC